MFSTVSQITPSSRLVLLFAYYIYSLSSALVHAQECDSIDFKLIITRANVLSDPLPTTCFKPTLDITQKGLKVVTLKTQQPESTEQKDFIPCFDSLSLPVTIQLQNQNKDLLCGINVLDLLRIQRQILALEQLPYFNQIAADVNKSSTISVADMLLIKKLILGKIIQLPKSESWEYFNNQLEGRSSYLSQDIWEDDNRIATLNSLPLQNTTFFGVKMGDVDLSCECLTQKEHPLLKTKTLLTEKSGILEFNAPELIAIQIEFSFFGEQLQMENLEFNSKLGMSQENVFIDESNRVLKLIWTSIDGETPLSSIDWLFRLKQKSVNLELIESKNNLAITSDFAKYKPQLILNIIKEKQGLDFTISPKPLNEKTALHFNDLRQGKLSVEVSHDSGLRTQQFHFKHNGGKDIYPLNIQSILPGQYVVRVYFHGESESMNL